MHLRDWLDGVAAGGDDSPASCWICRCKKSSKPDPFGTLRPPSWHCWYRLWQSHLHQWCGNRCRWPTLATTAAKSSLCNVTWSQVMTFADAQIRCIHDAYSLEIEQRNQHLVATRFIGRIPRKTHGTLIHLQVVHLPWQVTTRTIEVVDSHECKKTSWSFCKIIHLQSASFTYFTFCMLTNFPLSFPGLTCTTLAALFLHRSWRFGTGLFWPSQPTAIIWEYSIPSIEV